MRILLVYGFEPSGHSSAAQALEACCQARGIEAVRINVSADFHSFAGPLIARAYLQVVQRFPGLWDRLYDNQAVARVVRGWRRVYLSLLGDRLRIKLDEIKPDAIVCTHAPPLSALALERQKGGVRWPIIAVTTDYGVHTYWTASKADLYLTATGQAAASVVARGVAPGRVRDTGIPIHPTYEEPIDKAAARAHLGLRPDGPVLLLSGGSRGLGSMRKTAEFLLQRFPQARLMAVCGSNEALLKALKGCYGPGERRLWLFPTLDPVRMKELMCAADLLIGKAGGLTVAEALAVGLPMILFDPIPGQEARNAEYLLAEGAARNATSLEELGAVIDSALKPRGLKDLRVRSLALGRPDSAHRALEAIMRLVP